MELSTGHLADLIPIKIDVMIIVTLIVIFSIEEIMLSIVSVVYLLESHLENLM